jgi:hypothetical protein
MRGAFLPRLVMYIQDAHVFVIEQYLIMPRVDFRRVLRFRGNHSQDRYVDNWNEFFHYLISSCFGKRPQIPRLYFG